MSEQIFGADAERGRTVGERAVESDSAATAKNVF